MIDSAISRTVSLQMVTLNCQVRCSDKPCGEERNLSKDGRSICSYSRCSMPLPLSRYWLKKEAMSNSSKRSEEHTLNSSHGSISYAVFCLKKKRSIEIEQS